MLPVSNDYIGKIVNAEIQENNGKVSAIVICRPEGSLETVKWFGSFSETVVSGGFNEGKMVGAITAETLGAFGVTDFAKIGEIIGRDVAFGVKHKASDDGSGKVFANCNFIRPPGSQRPATASGLASIARFRGAAVAAAKNAPKVESGPPPGRFDDPEDDGRDPFA